jgi:glycosyltransferase involved in cell wall biosynthesis
MNIGMVVDNEFFNDPRVANEAVILSGAGHRVFVLCFDFGKYPDRNRFKEVRLSRIPFSRKLKDALFFAGNFFPLYYIYLAKKIRKFVAEHNIEALHLHDLYLMKAGIRVKAELNIPIIADLHENYPEVIKSYRWANKLPNRFFTRPDAWKTFEQKHLNKADKIVVLSNHFKKDILNRHPEIDPQKIIVYPNVPDVKAMEAYPITKNIFKRNKGETILLYFGGVSERRGVLTVFDALKILDDEKYSVRLLLIGPIDKAEKAMFEKKMTEKQMSDKVIYIPWIDISEFPSYVRQSDLCLSPIYKNAHHESGVANKVFQYMLFSKPVIVSDNKPQVEVIEENNSGLVFKSNDAHDLAEKISYMINNPEIRKQMGENGRNAVLTKYNMDAMGESLKSIYGNKLE